MIEMLPSRSTNYERGSNVSGEERMILKNGNGQYLSLGPQATFAYKKLTFPQIDRLARAELIIG